MFFLLLPSWTSLLSTQEEKDEKSPVSLFWSVKKGFTWSWTSNIRKNNHLHHTWRPPPHEEAWMGGSGQKVAKLIFLSVLTSVRITAPLTFPLWNRPARSWSELISAFQSLLSVREAATGCMANLGLPLCARNGSYSGKGRTQRNAVKLTALPWCWWVHGGRKIYLGAHIWRPGNG